MTSPGSDSQDDGRDMAETAMSEHWLQASSDIADLSDDELEILIDYTVGQLTDNPDGEPEKLMEALLTETARRRDAAATEQPGTEGEG